MKIPIVDENDNIINYKEREETTRDDIRRIIGLDIFNERGEVLIAKRHPNKKIDPGLWGPSVAGTVDEGFDYNDTVLKEAEEEVGLKNIQPIFNKKYFYETENARRWCSRYHVVIDSKTKLTKQDSEVSEIKWISVDDLEKWHQRHPEEFIPSFQRSMNFIKEIYENQN